MPDYPTHMYMVLYPNQAIVLSQLPPKDFVLRLRESAYREEVLPRRIRERKEKEK